ncbi:titin-like, partial [Asbolus verrucosus]
GRLRDEEEHETVEDRHNPHNYFPASADLSIRDPAREFKEKYAPEERNEEGNTIYEIADGSRGEEHYFDVIGYMKKIESDKPLKLFPHLQPNNLKPYGSNDNFFFPELYRKRPRIVYPVVNTTNRGDIKIKKIDEVPHKEYSSYRKENSVVSEELNKKISVCEKTSKSQKDFSKMNYSTACLTAKKLVGKTSIEKPPKLTVNASLMRKSSSNLLKKKKNKTKKYPIEDILEINRLGILDQFYKRANAYRDLKQTMKKGNESFFKNDSRTSLMNDILLNSSKDNISGSSRRYNTYTKPSSEDKSIHQEKQEEGNRSYNTYSMPSTARESYAKEEERIKRYSTYTKPSNSSNPPQCDNYITVKLGDLQEECRRQKKCKPKKISFGRLPKLTPSNCPCVEDIPLKEGKPLLRLKKRFDVQPKKKDCVVICGVTPRADANYKIKRKTLPQIKMEDCPCEDKEYLDFKIKRLPRRKIPEPPKVCVECVAEECCVPRSDAKLKIERKNLPKLAVNECPCVESPPLKDVPLHRLKPNPVEEPPKSCLPPLDCPLRADDNLKVKKKTLPILKSECICAEPPPILDVPPLRRLKRVKIKEKPCIPPPPCAVVERSDKNLKLKPKKLPPFVPQPCPCIEEHVPNTYVKLKRLKMRNVPKEKEKICLEEECGPRADDGLVVQPKKLPEIKPAECPCVEVVMEDAPPLKKLVPKPVKEPPRVCVEIEPCPPRSDESLTVAKKTLPVLSPGSCPCPEPEPLKEAPPLHKLKKKPVSFKRACPVEEKCPPRADEDLKVEIKRLPKLEVSDCPCIEEPVPEDVSLPRLKKVRVPEPPRICPPCVCSATPRADEDDWLYWKRVEVKSAECEPKKTTKRSFCTSVASSCNIFHAKKFYSTNIKPEYDLFHLKYDVANLRTNLLKGKSYNIIIDIKPSAPLILTQTPFKVNSTEQINNLGTNCLTRTKSEPIDCVTFIVYKSNSLACTQSKSGMVKESNDGINLFNTINRFISTCSTLCEYSERTKDKMKDHQTPQCECPPNDAHLQPRNPIIPEKETFIQPFPDNELIDNSIRKSRMYSRARKTTQEEVKEEESDECKDEEESALCEVEGDELPAPTVQQQPEKKTSLWEKIVNYFKARPDCPSPEEFKRIRLRKDAEKAASKAGLCLYDPKEMLRKNEKEMPKVITASKDQYRK